MTGKLELSRRNVLRGGLRLGSGFAILRYPLGEALAAEVETIAVTPDLISAAKREGNLVVRYSSPQDEMANMAGSFTAAFGIDVLLDRKVGVVGTQQFVAEERGGQHIMDVNQSADPFGIRELGKEGLYLRFVLEGLDKKLDKGAYFPELGYCPRWTNVVISYNPAQIGHARAKELLKTWNGLLDPALKGRIGMSEPGGGGVPFATYLMFYRHPQYGPEFLKRLAEQKPRLYPGSAPGREDLAAGAISVFLPNWEAACMASFMNGDKTAWISPEISPTYANGYLSISRNAPHPNAARLFVAWFFTPDGARVLQKSQELCTLKGMPDQRTAVAKLRQTDWWQPIPDDIAWVPDSDDWYDNYNKLMPEMRKAVNWLQ